MKYIAIIIFIVGMVFPTSTFAQSKGDKDQVSVRVDGLGCPYCAYGLEKKIKKLKGIKKIKIDIEEGIMTFNYPSEEKISLATIDQQVADAGYTPISVEITRYDGKKEVLKMEEKTFDEADLVEETFFVAGKCDMCRSRIEGTAKRMKGVADAKWIQESQMLTVRYHPDFHAVEDIHKAIAKIGHDTEKYSAKDKVYRDLPACCHYDRKAK